MASGGFNSSAVVVQSKLIKTEPFSTTSAVPVDVPEMSITVTPKCQRTLNLIMVEHSFTASNGLLTHFY